MLKSFISAFLMYSKIPMPNIEWKDENRRYSLGFFPVIGAVVGAVLILLRFVCDKLCIGQVLFSAAAVVIPVMISGGIHIDGFCDVTDAIHSYGDRNKKLEIMSDPHVGSFAVIYAVLYFILQFGLFTQISTVKSALLVSFGYILSRTLSAFSALTFKAAKKESSLTSFISHADRKIIFLMGIVYIILCISALFLLSFVTALTVVLVMPICFLCFRKMAYSRFGGITGDLCGWFLQTAEIAYLAAVVVSLKITEVFL